MNEKVIKLLNEARARELLAISQYMIHHHELEDADFGKLADRLKAIAIVEMKHAEELAERILFLGGSPTTQPSGVAEKGQAIKELLQTDISLEQGAIKMYNDSAKASAEAGDNVTKTLFERLLADEEEHFNEFDNTLDHVQKLGDVYLATLTG